MSIKMNNSFLATYKLFTYLPNHRRRQSYGLIIVMIISAIAELVSIGAIIPFINSFGKEENPLAKFVIEQVPAITENTYIYWMLGTYLTINLISLIIKTSNLWLTNYIAAAIGNDLTKILLTSVIAQDFINLVRLKSSDVVNIVSIQVNLTVVVFGQFFQTISNSILIALIFIGFIKLDPSIGLMLIITLSSIYFAIYSSIKKVLVKNGKLILRMGEQVINAIQEMVIMAREIQIYNLGTMKIEAIAQSDKKMRSGQVTNTFLSLSPKFIMEFLFVIVFCLYLGISHANNISFTSIISYLAALVLGSQKILPAFQQIYSCMTANKGSIKSIKEIIILIETDRYKISTKVGTLGTSQNNPIKTIKANDIEFSYPSEESPIFNFGNFTIKTGEFIGIIGQSGSGKTTLISLLLGLLKPTSGTFEIEMLNNEKIINPLSQKQLFSYVPQKVSLMSSNIMDNIIFGNKVPIDLEDIDRISKNAEIFDFIHSLPDSYYTNLRNSGNQISGGQIQRIGIARALYKRRPILILDEATSSLDSTTAAKLLLNIKRLCSEERITVIMITHKKEELEFCSNIFHIKNGTLKLEE